MTNDSLQNDKLTTNVRVFRRIRRQEMARVGKFLRGEKVGGIIIMLSAVLGFFFANSPFAHQFEEFEHIKLGVHIFDIDLTMSLSHWAADGLLAIFFFVVGLELKNEFVHGALQKMSTALVPVAAACGGVLMPALIYAIVNAQSGFIHGWAIPTATDIAFAVAILGLIAPGIPGVLRMFLLTLAVVDDLITIIIITVSYTSGLNFLALAAALIPLALYAILTRVFYRFFIVHSWLAWGILLPIGLATWVCFYLSGVHATLSGVVLAFLVPTRGAVKEVNLAERLAFRFQPLSSGFAVPIFALFSAAVSIGGDNHFPFHPIVFGIVLGLVLGKPIGITLITWLVTRFTKAELGGSITWRQFAGVASIAGVGFTVSLLVSELSFVDESLVNTARLAVMVGSLLAIVLASVFLLFDRRHSRLPADVTEKINIAD